MTEPPIPPATQPPATKKPKPVYEVAIPFHDIYNMNVMHEEGKDVSNFQPERLNQLIELGHVKIKN